MPKRQPHARAAALSAAFALLLVGCRSADETGPSYASATSSGAGGAAGGSGGASGAGGSGGPGQPLAVLNWNTRNFFNDKDDSVAQSETVVSAAQYRAKRAAIAAVLKQLDPDVAVLQEVEHLGVLEDLNTGELGGAYPHAALIESEDPRGIDVGALSKIPFDQVVSHREDRFPLAGTQGPIYRFARDCVELHLTLNKRKVILLGVHFRSKGPPDDPDKRLAEAQRARAIADGLAAADPTAAIAVLGDFNDVTGSPPFKAVAGSGEGAFVDAAASLAPSDQWTYDFNGQLELIDHQMANPLLHAMLGQGGVEIPHSAAIEDASDHAPTMATYAITAP